MVRYIFLGLQYNNESEGEYLALSKHGLSAASNELQWGVCDGFIQSIDAGFEILTALPVGSFPKYFRKAYLKNETWKYKGVSVTEIGSWNVPILKQATREQKCVYYLQKWIKNSPDDLHVVILYSLYLPYLKAIQRIKRENATLYSVIIVPDLPGQYGILPGNPLKAKLATAIGDKALKLAEALDAYVVLTKQMTQILKVKNKPYVVIEGICNDMELQLAIKKEHDFPFYFFYAGTLKRECGIINLLDAFETADAAHVELWICGAGETEHEIKIRSQRNPRIRYLGFKTKDEVRRIQSEAIALVNPRTTEGEYTKYSFPSKTMGYMASGRPVIMYKLDGIPDEYDQYLIYPRDSSVESLADAMKYALAMPEEKRIAFGKAAQNFIFSQKNSKVQAGKILDMIYNENHH